VSNAWKEFRVNFIKSHGATKNLSGCQCKALDFTFIYIYIHINSTTWILQFAGH